MRKVLIFLVIAILSAPAMAQWRRAELYGADVRALIVHPAEPDTLFLGTSTGEVYVSRDGAKTWQNPRHGVPFPGYVVDNLAIDRNGRLWAACWGLWGGGVIAVSGDGARTWMRRDKGLEDFSVRAIAIDPNDANFLVAGGLTGVYRSADGGLTWEKISEQINVESLAIDPRSRDRIYAGTWRQGIRTTDGGKTWELINDGMVLDTDMFGITIDAENPDNLWVSTCGWVYNSTNGGDRWVRYRDGFNNRRIHDVKLDPCDRNRLWAGSVAGLYRSDDGGRTWYAVSDERLVINSIALHPQRPGRIVLGVEGDGVYVSNDDAKTFARASEGLYNVRVATIAADPLVKDRVYAAVTFGGLSSGIYRSSDGGVRWERLNATELPEVLSLVVAPEQDAETRFVAGTTQGFFWSTDGVEWTKAEPVNTALRASKVIRFNRMRYFAATSEGVLTSRDGGRSWYRLAGAAARATDLAVGRLGGAAALFALTDEGVAVFDGAEWRLAANAPAKGRSLAAQRDVLFVAGARGVKAGRIADDFSWVAVEVPDAQYAAVFGSGPAAEPMLFLTARRTREILLSSREAEWMSMPLPAQHAEVTTIAPDPFEPKRIYAGTAGEGIFVFEGKATKYVMGKTPHDASAASGGGR
ncbi:MAG TPA: hypothetical protein VNL91_07625 [Thermoanaerobaculia bacterium]|nr:hypothetical protein [Thermoanaerobaculia bacterium]